MKKKIIVSLTLLLGVRELSCATSYSQTSFSIFNKAHTDSAPTELSAVPLMSFNKVPTSNIYPDAEAKPHTAVAQKCYLNTTLFVENPNNFPPKIGPATTLYIREGLLESNFAHICVIISLDLCIVNHGLYDQKKPIMTYRKTQPNTPTAPQQKGSGPALIKRTFAKDLNDDISDNYFVLSNLNPGNYVLFMAVETRSNTSPLLPPTVTTPDPLFFTVLDPNDPQQNNDLCNIQKNEEDTSVS